MPINIKPNTSAPIAMPIQNPRKPFPAWRLPNGMINASDEELECSIGSCERWGWAGGGLVVLGVLATVCIAAFHPPYDSFWERWGTAIADIFVALGVAAEVIFVAMAGFRQNELKMRLEKKLIDTNKVATQAIEEAKLLRQKAEELQKQSDFNFSLGASK